MTTGRDTRRARHGAPGVGLATPLAILAALAALATGGVFLWNSGLPKDVPGAGLDGSARGSAGDARNGLPRDAPGSSAAGAGRANDGRGDRNDSGGAGAPGVDPASRAGFEAGRNGARLGARLATAFAQARGRDEVERALEADGYVLDREPVATGSTGARSRTVFTGGPAALVHGRLEWSGEDAETLRIEHVRLVAEEAKSDFEALREQYERELPAAGYSLADATGPDGALVWRNASTAKMIVLGRHDERVPHPYEGLPARVSIVTIHGDIHAHAEVP